MKRKISALLLTILLAMTVAFDAFAWNYSLDGTGITPPARFTSVEETADGLECKTSGNGSREFLTYMSAGPASETAVKKLANKLISSFRADGYEIAQNLKKVKCGDGRKAMYFFFDGHEDFYFYGYAAFIPGKGGRYVAVIDMLGTGKKEAGAFPFSKKDIKRIASTIEG